MFSNWIKIFVVLSLFFSFTYSYSQDAASIYEKTVNSTVTIETNNGVGSGFFVGKNIIATNFHVINGAYSASCYLNNSTSKYKIDGYLGYDKESDLILLQVSGLNMPFVKISANNVTPGQKVFVIGSPIGLPATISDGIVSGLRSFNGIKLIQITAPISHGSSGGPVLNNNGEVIGVSVGQISEGQNLNFAIPIINLERLLNQKKSYCTPISSLNSTSYKNETEPPVYIVNERIYKIGTFDDRNQIVSLDYYATVDEFSLFFLTCRGSQEEFQKALKANYRLVNIETGDMYYSVMKDSPKSPNSMNSKETNYRFCIGFNKIPVGVNNLSLMQGDCQGKSFCFTYINLLEYHEVIDFDISLYVNLSKKK
jgi:hypothetical protein